MESIMATENKTFGLVIVVPVGPAAEQEHIVDTMDSIEHFICCRYKVILLDDSQKGTGKEIKQMFPGIDVIATTKSSGNWCGLYVSLSLAYSYALRHYDFTMLLKLGRVRPILR